MAGLGRRFHSRVRIELISKLLWRQHVRETPIPHYFKARTGRVLSALRSLPEIPTQIVEPLVRAMKLADKRNTIAHHPLQVQVFQHSKAGELIFEQAISSATREANIDDLELIEARAEAEGIAADLYLAIGFTDPREQGPVKIR